MCDWFVEKIIELESLISQLEHEGDYFLDFVNLQHLQAGILRLQPREEDIQEPHPFDEIYFVIRGDGFILINNKKYNIKAHSFIYVPANTEHRFLGNSEEILVAYFFGHWNFAYFFVTSALWWKLLFSVFFVVKECLTGPWLYDIVWLSKKWFFHVRSTFITSRTFDFRAAW